jgi:hypothetical protein
MNRRTFLASAAPLALRAADTKPKLLLPSDVPDESNLRIMWYNPVPPIDRKTYKLAIKGLVQKPLTVTLEQMRRLPRNAEFADEVRPMLVGAAVVGRLPVRAPAGDCQAYQSGEGGADRLRG